MKAKIGDLVSVSWLDAVQDEDVTPKDLRSELPTVTTVGFLVQATAVLISVAQEWVQDNGSHGLRAVCTIPTAVVTEVVVLRGKR